MPEIYFSLDIETNGPIPGLNAMLSMGFAAFTEATGLDPIATYYKKTAPLFGTKPDPDTVAWWEATDKEMWLDLNKDGMDLDVAIPDCINWINAVTESVPDGKPVCVAAPVGYDFTHWRWAAVSFNGKKETPFKHRCLDIRSFTMPLFGKPFLKSGKEAIPTRLRSSVPHNHNAVQDAIGQGQEFMNLLQEAREIRAAAAAWVKLAPSIKTMADRYNETRKYVGEQLKCEAV